MINGDGWLPLAGVRVVYTADEEGEMCGRILGDLGADVLRLEPAQGAVSRGLPPFCGSTSLHFAVRNANKRVGILDLEAPGAPQNLTTLLSGADVWIESTRPGFWKSTELSPVVVCDRIPRLIVASITPFGQTGPYRHYAATDPVIVAMSSMLSRSGVPDRPPPLPPGTVAYDCAGVLGAFAILLALWQRVTQDWGSGSICLHSTPSLNPPTGGSSAIALLWPPERRIESAGTARVRTPSTTAPTGWSGCPSSKCTSGGR